MSLDEMMRAKFLDEAAAALKEVLDRMDDRTVARFVMISGGRVGFDTGELALALAERGVRVSGQWRPRTGPT